MKPIIRALVFAGLLVVVACTTTGDSSDSWSRSYLAQRDRVIEAVVEVLEDENYLVDVKKDGGRIEAEPSRSAGHGRANLVVSVEEKNGRIRVDVQSRAGVDSTGRQGSQVEAQILEFLHQLDLELKR
jgi:hypothetical protein